MVPDGFQGLEKGNLLARSMVYILVQLQLSKIWAFIKIHGTFSACKQIQIHPLDVLHATALSSGLAFSDT